jgi:hypothetical protein
MDPNQARQAFIVLLDLRHSNSQAVLRNPAPVPHKASQHDARPIDIIRRILSFSLAEAAVEASSLAMEVEVVDL